MKKVKWNRLGLVTVFTVIMCVISFMLANNVKADPQIINVPPGSGTLEAAVKKANAGDVLKLQDGSYNGDKTIIIDKSLTIEGVGNYRDSGPRTYIENPIKITSGEVNLKKYSIIPSYGVSGSKVTVAGKADVNISSVTYFNIASRAISDAKTIDVTEEANDSTINITDSEINEGQVVYGIFVAASNTTIKLDNTYVYGLTAIKYSNGGSNNLTIGKGNNSKINGGGPSPYNKTIDVENQNGLNIIVDGGEINSLSSRNNIPISVFSFGSGCKNVDVDIKAGSKISYKNNYNQQRSKSIIFDFPKNATSSDGYEIKINKDAKIDLQLVEGSTEKEREELPLERLYSTIDGGAVIGIYDNEGNGKVNIYDNETEIAPLTSKEYTDIDTDEQKYIFKGWFKDKDYQVEYAKVGESYPKAVSGTNMNLYAHLVKSLTLTIKDVPKETGTENKTYKIEEGQVLSKSEQIENIRNDLVAISNKEGQEFRGFVVYNLDSSVPYTDIDTLINNLVMKEDCRIEAIHKVKVTINNVDFYIDAGQSLNDIMNDPNQSSKYKDAIMIGSEGRDFSRFVLKNKGDITDTTVSVGDSLPVNIEIVSKFYQDITIGGVVYKLEEGKTLNSSEEIKTALEAIKPEVAGQKFGRFVDNTDKATEIYPESTQINKNMTIEAIYQIKVKLSGKENPDKEYTIDVGSTLKSVGNNIGVKEALEDVSKNIAVGHKFDGFIVSNDLNSTHQTFDIDEYSNDMDKLKEAVLDTTLYYNTTIYAKYVATVIINCPNDICGGSDNKKTFDVETGTTLADIKDSDYQTAKYQKYEDDPKKDERFYRFVDSDEKEFKETDEITKSITLTPKYLVFVTIDDTRVGGTYKLEKGKSINDIIGEDAQKALRTLRNNIIPEDVNVSNSNDLHFEKLVDDKNVVVPEKIDDDITIKGIYHYDVIVVKDYDNPEIGDLGGSHGPEYAGFTIQRDNNLGSNDDIEEALTALKNSVNSGKNRQFYKYLVKTNYNGKTDEYDDSNILNDKFNRHIVINALVSYKVKVLGDNKDYYVVEGMPISSNTELVQAIENLYNNDSDYFSKYTLNGKLVDNIDVIKNTIVNDGNNEIGARYNVKVNINGKDFVIEKGKNLSTYTESDLESYLDTLENPGDKEFVKYVVNGKELSREDLLKENFDSNTTVKVKYNVRITVGDGGDSVVLPEGSKVTEELKEKMDSVSVPEGKSSVAYFEDSDKNKIDDKYMFNKSMTINPKYNVKITIEGLEEPNYQEVLEGSKIGDATELINKLKNNNEKDFKEFSDSKTLESTVSENIILTPLYTINVTVDGVTYTLDEGKTLGDLSGVGPNGPTPERFKEFRDKKGNKVDTTTPLHKHTEVNAIYTIIVTTPDKNTHELESGQKLSDLGQELLDSFKKSEDGRNFSRFVDQDGNTLKEDDTLTKDITLVPKFNIKIEVFRRDEEGNEIKDDTVTFELGENLPLSGVISEEGKKLQNWVDEVVKKLEKEGKTNYAWTKFLTEDGKDIDLNTYLFSQDSRIEAVFAEKKPDTPDLGDITGKDDNANNIQKDKPSKAPVPDTGKEMNTLVSSVMSGFIFVLITLLVFGPAVVLQAEKLRNK